LFARHVGLVPAIRRDDPAIGRGPVVDHLVDRRNVGRPAIADHEAVSLAPAWANGPALAAGCAEIRVLDSRAFFGEGPEKSGQGEAGDQEATSTGPVRASR